MSAIARKSRSRRGPQVRYDHLGQLGQIDTGPFVFDKPNLKVIEAGDENFIEPLTLREFIAGAWDVLEPATEFVPGWHIDAIADHLTAVSAGEIQNLVINVPPGCMKSLLVSVMWPAWDWTIKPSRRFLTASYAQALATRDALKARRLIQSHWYQSRWGDRFQLAEDQNAKTRYENDQTGFRIALSVNGLGTGERGDIRICDDPHSVKEAQSDAHREAAVEWAKTTWSSRKSSKESAEVLIMQRLHERDVAGLYLDELEGYEHLMLPMEFEPDRKCVTSIGFEDPRSEDGELLAPDRFDRAEVDKQAATLGSYAAAGQLQQRPAPREGGLFERVWFGTVPAAPAGGKVVRAWDLAATEATQGTDPAWTVGLRMRLVKGIYYIEHVVRLRGGPGEVERTIQTTAEQDGTGVQVSMPQDPGQAGKAQAQHLVRLLAGFNARTSPESGDKVTRAEALSAQAEAGNVKLVKGAWNDVFLDEFELFPNGRFKDQVDAGSRAFHHLTSAHEPRSGWLV